MKYHTALENQWSNFCKEIKKGSLNPTDDNELIKMIVDKINEDILISKPVAFKPYFYKDLKFYKIKKSHNFNNNTHCIFTGIKILFDIKNKQELLDESEKIIKYLYNKFGEGSGVRNKLIIYDKTNSLTDRDIKQLKECQKTNRVKIYLC